MSTRLINAIEHRRCKRKITAIDKGARYNLFLANMEKLHDLKRSIPNSVFSSIFSEVRDNTTGSKT